MGATGEICLVHDVIRDQFFQLDFRHFTGLLKQFYCSFGMIFPSPLLRREKVSAAKFVLLSQWQRKISDKV